jgi:hypothetical protein
MKGLAQASLRFSWTGPLFISPGPDHGVRGEPVALNATVPADLGVFARSAEGFARLDHFLTTERLQELLRETADLLVDRHRLPKVWSLNSLVHGILQEGVAVSVRQDKSLGEWLRARHVDLPASLLPSP